jgi:hypothetical protein
MFIDFPRTILKCLLKIYEIEKLIQGGNAWSSELMHKYIDQLGEEGRGFKSWYPPEDIKKTKYHNINTFVLGFWISKQSKQISITVNVL